MAYAWQSVEEAAVTLQISTRTLHRRISKNEVETRLANGRREVLVCLPDEEEEVQAEAREAEGMSAAVTDGVGAGGGAGMSDSTAIVLAEKEAALANEKFRRTELALAAFQHTSQILQKEASRTRISARLAWSAVAVLSVGGYVAVGWTASKVTAAKKDNERLTADVERLTADVKEREELTTKLREQFMDARQATARMQGELTVTKEQLTVVKKPTTQPSGLMQWMAKLGME